MGLKVPRYGQGRYGGFLITARCDLAHVRTDTVNVLPVVPLVEWIMFDGCIGILLSRILALEARLEELIEGLDPSLKSLIGADWIPGYEQFIAPNTSWNPVEREKIRQAVEEYSELQAVLGSSCGRPVELKTALAKYPRFRKLIERERPKRLAALVENKVLDAHFLPVIRPEEELHKGPGYVVLFRQIATISGSLLDPLRRGIAAIEELPEPVRPSAARAILCPAEIVGNVASPHVEHVLQRFANVFGRVGVTNCTPQYRNWIVEQTCESTPL